jgi:hypothetical protein
MANKKRPEQVFTAYDGSERLRRFQTRYWLDARKAEPLRNHKGFPKTEDGSLEGVGRLALKGWIAKAQCFDWVEGKVLWTVKRGAKVAGANLYSVHTFKGDPDA